MRVAVAVLALALVGCPLDPDALPELVFEVPAEDAWSSPPLAPPPQPGDGRIIATNNLDDTVTVVDLDRALAGDPDARLAQVPVGFVPVEREGPHHLVADPAGEFYYLGISNFVPGSGSGPHGVHGAGTADGHIMKMRVADNALVGSVRIDRNPGDVRLTPDGSLLLASHFDLLKVTQAVTAGFESGPELDSRLVLADPVTMTRVAVVPTCPAAHGIAVTADGTRAVTSCMSDEVAIVDLTSDAHPVTRVTVLAAPGTALQPVCFPYAITMDGDIAWTSCFNSGQVIAVDAAAGALDGRVVQLPGAALFGDVSRADVNAGLMVLAHQNADGLTFLDPEGPSVSSTRSFQPGECILPHTARFSDDGTQVLVVCEGDKATPGTLLVLDATAPHAILGTTSLGLFPDDIAVVRRAP